MTGKPESVDTGAFQRTQTGLGPNSVESPRISAWVSATAHIRPHKRAHARPWSRAQTA
jgi:hypothetical protein